MADYLATLALLFALELVLGVDNIVVISILVSRLPEELRRKARLIGLGLALLARLLMVLAFSWLLALDNPIVGDFSIRDAILLLGGGFLIWKAVREIHHTVEMVGHSESQQAQPRAVFASAIAMIVVMDMVFALDSVVTAFGMTDNIAVIWAAVILSFAVLLFFAGPVGEFIHNNPTFKILALAFLITIGVVLILESFHNDVPKAYIYLPMGFATGVQLLQWRYSLNQKRKQKA
ncbi:MAG TPA: TerC family protein [Oceanipulchritudo sp.]|nr:TerC family protein [Oceanipulchritudo sp.]